MEKTYGVRLGEQERGKVQVLRQGLYYRFICRCRLSGEVMCRLMVSCGEHQENLGVLIPMEDGFGLDTKLPVKRLGEGEMEISLHPKHEAGEGKFIPIYPEEPFSYLEKLKDAYLVCKGSEVGILVQET